MNIAEAKEALDFRGLVEQTHVIDRNGKASCPVHEDRNPSLHIYADHAYCFACGWHGDAIEWLKVTRDLATADALKEAGRLAGAIPASRPTRPRPNRPQRRSACDADPLPEGVLKKHVKAVEVTYRVPPALSGRGFTAQDVPTLLLAEGEDGAGLFPILSPSGELLNVKKRHLRPAGGQRYSYLVAGRGAPAWCSPMILDATDVLVIEGELNGMAAWLACSELGVMGTAGANGCLHRSALRGKGVHIYADGDAAGDQARERWAREATAAGAIKVFVLRPWPDGDACDVAGRLSRQHLRERLL